MRKAIIMLCRGKPMAEPWQQILHNDPLQFDSNPPPHALWSGNLHYAWNYNTHGVNIRVLVTTLQ